MLIAKSWEHKETQTNVHNQSKAIWTLRQDNRKDMGCPLQKEAGTSGHREM